MTPSTLRRIAHTISGVAEKVLGLSDYVLLDLALGKHRLGAKRKDSGC
jgi:hypothetical protein